MTSAPDRVRSAATSDARRALLDAVLHNAVLLAGVLLWGWSLSLLIAAVWFEMLFSACVLRAFVYRSRHGNVVVEPELARLRPQRPAPTLRRRSGEMLIAVGAVGVFLGLGGISMAGLDGIGDLLGWTPAGLAQAALLGIAGSAFALQRSWRGLRDDRRDTLCASYEHQSQAIACAIMILVIVPWFVLLAGAAGVVIAFFVARGASDYWLARRAPIPA